MKDEGLALAPSTHLFCFSVLLGSQVMKSHDKNNRFLHRVETETAFRSIWTQTVKYINLLSNFLTKMRDDEFRDFLLLFRRQEWLLVVCRAFCGSQQTHCRPFKGPKAPCRTFRWQHIHWTNDLNQTSSSNCVIKLHPWNMSCGTLEFLSAKRKSWFCFCGRLSNFHSWHISKPKLLIMLAYLCPVFKTPKERFYFLRLSWNFRTSVWFGLNADSAFHLNPSFTV